MKIRIFVVACVATLGAGASTNQQRVPGGVVIEGVEKGSAPDLAGVQAGDVLIEWARSATDPSAAGSRGQFNTPFDARAFELEQLPRGGTTVTVMRQGSRIDRSLIAGSGV